MGESVQSDPSLTFNNATGAGDKYEAGASTWENITVYDEESDSFASVGQYKVCFLDGSSGAKWRQIPSTAGDVYLEVVAEDDYSQHPRKVFTYQTLSGKAGETNTFVLKGHRLRLPSTDKIGLWKDGCTGTKQDVTASIDEAKSTADGYSFSGTVSDDLAAGTYDVCYCKGSDDATLNGDTKQTYVVTADKTCGTTPTKEGGNTNVAFDVLTAATQNDICTVKCARGCVGQNCYCDSFDPDTMFVADSTAGLTADKSYPLCLSVTGCRDACTANKDVCGGFDYDPATNFCWLMSAATKADCPDGMTTKEGFEYWERKEGEACTDDADFSSKVGTVTITKRVSIGNDWILTPGVSGSIEVLGESLNWKTDRIMYIDCTGICGISENPHSAVSTFNNWVPEKPVFEDPPHDDDEGPYVAETDTDDADVLWRKKSGKYCPGNNMDVVCREDTPGFVDPDGFTCADWAGDWDGNGVPDCFASVDDVSYAAGYSPAELEALRAECPKSCGVCLDTAAAEPSRHQCYKKCVTNAPCKGDDCNCDGLLQGYDGPDSQALCLTESQCKLMCEDIDDCYGIDMATGSPRCFLNGKTIGANDQSTCEEYIINDQLTSLSDYDFFYKQRPDEERRATEMELSPRRKLLAAQDTGASWDAILRFKGTSVATGAQYKVCFCDRDTLAAGRFCKKASDYKIDIGTLHFSGVSCLIADSKFQRGTCVEQYHGGLRCYPGAAPTLTVPSVNATKRIPKDAKYAAAVDAELSAYCLYGPEEETREDPMCP